MRNGEEKQGQYIFLSKYAKFLNNIISKYTNMNPDHQNLIQSIPRLCMSLGIVKSKYNQQGEMILGHMPVSLYPYELSAKTYYKLIRVHNVWQSLVTKAASDRQFMKATVSNAMASDEFVKRLFSIYEKHYKQDEVGVASTRVDYMGDENPNLVEFNLMSVGLNGITDRVQELTNTLKKDRIKEGKPLYPTNRNQFVFGQAIEHGLQNSYKKQGYILMMAHDKQFNFGDQSAFFLEMIKRGFNVLRVTFNSFIEKVELDENSNLFYEGKLISCIYWRTGYSPVHYPTEQHWKAREMIESSKALKVPSTRMQIVNAKRFQAQFSKIQVLKKFLSDEDAQLIYEVGGYIKDFDGDLNLEEILKNMKEEPFVLKPNREGGGSNFFGEKAVEKFIEVKDDKKELQKYVLMKKIKSTILSNEFIANFTSKWVQKATCQFSTFGSFMYKGSEVFYNEAGGSLVRLKKEEVDEGGIAIDQAVIAGLCLVDEG